MHAKYTPYDTAVPLVLETSALIFTVSDVDQLQEKSKEKQWPSPTGTNLVINVKKV